MQALAVECAVLKFISLFSGTLGGTKEKERKMGQTVGCAGGQRETRETRAREGKMGSERDVHDRIVWSTE